MLCCVVLFGGFFFFFFFFLVGWLVVWLVVSFSSFVGALLVALFLSFFVVCVARMNHTSKWSSDTESERECVCVCVLSSVRGMQDHTHTHILSLSPQPPLPLRDHLAFALYLCAKQKREKANRVGKEYSSINAAAKKRLASINAHKGFKNHKQASRAVSKHKRKQRKQGEKKC